MLEFREELVKFLKFNFDKRNVFDNKYLEKLRDVALIGRDSSYIDSIKSKFILFEELGTLATYDEEKIKIYLFNRILQYLFYTRRYGVRFNRDAFKLHSYAGILHEIMHSYQLDMTINSKESSIFNKIIKDSLLVSAGDIHLEENPIKSFDEKKASKLYRSIYPLFPEERQATLSAYYFMLDLYSSLKPQNINVLYDFHTYIILSNIEEYIYKDKIISPLKRFYKAIDRLDLFDKMCFDDVGLRDKFIYGMPLDSKELYEVCYPFIVYNDIGEVFFEEERVAREKWVKKYVK